MESATRNPLLTHLRELKPNRLYSLVDARTMKAALSDFADNAVHSFAWDENGTILVAEIARPRISVETRTVHLALANNRLLAQCTCPFSPTCRHVTVTLMTIARLLRGAQFTATAYRKPQEWDDLLRQLLRGDETTGGETTALSGARAKNAIPLLAVPVHDAHFTLIPATRDPFAPEAPRHVLAGKGKLVDEETFLTWWPEAGTAGDFSLAVLMEGANRLTVEPGPIASTTGGTEFRSSNGKVTITCFVDLDGRREAHLVRLGTHIVFLPKQRRLLWLDNPNSWTLFEGMPSFADIRDRRPGIRSASFRPRIPLTLPAAEFNRSGFVLRTENGIPEPVPESIHMLPDPGRNLPRFKINPEIEIEFDPALGDVSLFPRILAADGTEFAHVAAVLHSMLNASDLVAFRDRYDDTLDTLAYQTIWNLILAGSPEEQETILANVRQNPEFEDDEEIEGVLDFADTVLAEITGPENVEAEIVALENDRAAPWGYLRSPLRAAARTAAVLGSVLQDTGRWDIWHSSVFFRGRSDLVLERLGLLLEKCKAHRITLKYQALPISAGALDFKVSAERPPGNHDAIDWFELKPEVTCDGFEIPPERWNELLRGNLFHVAHDGGVRLLTLDSVETLAKLRAVYERTTGRSLDAEGGKKHDDDKETFSVPRLQILDWIALAQSGVKLDLPPEEKAVLDALVSFEKMRAVPMPATVLATLRPYQNEGFQWLAFLYEHRFGACLADDMGLGKTIQTITLLAAIKDGTVRRVGEKKSTVRTPHLIVLPPTLVFNWESEIARFAPNLRVLEYTGTARKKLDFTGADVILTTYELVRRDIDDLKERQFDIVIFDEAQAVKNDRGARSKAVRQLPARFRLCLTGTPMENHVGEYFSVIELALPGLLGDRKRFIREANLSPDCPQLVRARPFVLRRTKEKILKELPPKVESNIHLDLTKRQKEIYSRTVAAVREEVAAAFADKAEQQAGIVALAALTRLRQVCISPALLDPDYNETAPKLEHLVLKLAELTAEGHAALVFSQFTRALDTFEHSLRANDLPFQRLDGKTPSDQRRGLVQGFQDGTGPGIFLISLKTGGAGLNLTRASYVFHLDPWWNPAVENQASDRAHRIGQTQTVFVTRLLMRHTIEEKMMELKARKQEIYDQIVNQSAAPGQTRKAGAITREDMAFLLGT